MSKTGSVVLSSSFDCTLLTSGWLWACPGGVSVSHTHVIRQRLIPVALSKVGKSPWKKGSIFFCFMSKTVRVVLSPIFYCTLLTSGWLWACLGGVSASHTCHLAKADRCGLGKGRKVFLEEGQSLFLFYVKNRKCSTFFLIYLHFTHFWMIEGVSRGCVCVPHMSSGKG